MVSILLSRLYRKVLQAVVPGIPIFMVDVLTIPLMGTPLFYHSTASLDPPCAALFLFRLRGELPILTFIVTLFRIFVAWTTHFSSSDVGAKSIPGPTRPRSRFSY